MTLWARKSGFQEHFDDEWNIEMEEMVDEVKFIATPKENVTFDLESTNFSYIESYLTGVGAHTVEMFYNKDEHEFGFEIIVDRDKLPTDYDEEL